MFTLFNALPLVWRLGSYAVVAVAVVAAYATWHRHVYNAGYEAAIAAVARADQDAIERVKDGVKDLVACRTNGGTWDVVTGTCK